MTEKRIRSPEREYLRVILSVKSEDAEVVSELLWGSGTLGFVEELTSLETRFTIFFPDHRSLDEWEEVLRKRKIAHSALSSELFLFDEDEWARHYSEHFSGFEASPSIYVHPSWDDPSPSHPVNLLLEPGHGFGTGTHESTQLALLSLEKLAPSMHSMLDFGTGSGILTLAARKLNPALNCASFDIDPMAVAFAASNLERNGVRGVALFAGPADALREDYELVVANLAVGIFNAQAPEIGRFARKHFVLSGFTRDQRQLVFDAFQRCFPFHLRQEWERNDWLCFHCER